MRRARPGAGERLATALRAALPPFDGTAEVAVVANESWTSITFAGERHRLRLEIEGRGAAAAADALIAALVEPDYELPGHLLVDLRVTGDRRGAGGTRVELELAAITVGKG